MGSARISYAKMMELLANKQIKRITFYGNQKVAIIDYVIPNAGHFLEDARWSDFGEDAYMREYPEFKQESIRFYVELPGDFWVNSQIAELCYDALPHRLGNRCASAVPVCNELASSRMRACAAVAAQALLRLSMHACM